MIDNKGATLILKILENNGYKGYFVGGCVRDDILKRDINDIDITTNCKPEKTKEIFSKEGYGVIETGIKHGTVAVVIDKEVFEVTTFRQDGDYDDNRHPSNVVFLNDVREDLARRDFTINAMAFNPNEGLIDPFGGREDIDKKIIRTVGNPDDRFNEDGLRILRALRFSSKLGFSIKEETKKSIFKNKDLLNSISKERIHEELIGILMGDNFYSILDEYREVIFTIIPELKASDKFDHMSRYHYLNVYDHIIKTITFSEKDKNTRVALLLHDIGKPFSYTFDGENRHFKGHQLVSYNMSKEILLRLKFSNEDSKEILNLILYHDDYLGHSKGYIRKFVGKYGIDFVAKLTKLRKCDILAHNKLAIDRGLREIERFYSIAKEAVDSNFCVSIKMLDINGDDLLALGYTGIQIGEILDKLLDLVTNDKVENKKEELIKNI